MIDIVVIRWIGNLMRVCAFCVLSSVDTAGGLYQFRRMIGSFCASLKSTTNNMLLHVNPANGAASRAPPLYPHHVRSAATTAVRIRTSGCTLEDWSMPLSKSWMFWGLFLFAKK